MSATLYRLSRCWRCIGEGAGPQTTLPFAERNSCQAHPILSNIITNQCILQAGNM